jgi:hypothetical protein
VEDVRACSRGMLVLPSEAREALGREPMEGPVTIRRSLQRPPEPDRVAEEGMWIMDNEIYKVQIAHHGSGRPYAKILLKFFDDDGKLTHCEWDRAKGAQYRLPKYGRRMTLEEAQEFGKLYGWCCRCGTILTNETSIAEGIGPVCAGKSW